MLKNFFRMNDETTDEFMLCFSKFSPESIKNEYYSDLLTHLDKDIYVENTKVHFIYANKMGEKYLKRYKKYFRDPEIREFDMQHEQWLFGGEEYAAPVLKAMSVTNAAEYCAGVNFSMPLMYLSNKAASTLSTSPSSSTSPASVNANTTTAFPLSCLSFIFYIYY